ncbi:SLAP domain-containing protein [Lactobacillus juensis]|uniref:SLAP domain-containing protein n=1 Tax=Lactobacillus juensis TaxID=3082862 RepID=UPI0030C66765
MLGKNNYNERLRKMEMQDKQDHFSIRKLSIGAASVLLGFTFFGLNSQSVKADTVEPAQQVSEESNRDNSNTETKETSTKDTTKVDATASKKKTGTDLSTFSGLSSFLKDSKTSEVKDTTAKDKADTTKDKADKDTADKDKQEATTADSNNSATTPATGSDKGNQDTTTDKTPTDITGSDDQNSDSSKLPADVTGDTNSDKDTTVSDEDTTTVDKPGLDVKAVQTKVDDYTPLIIGNVAKVTTWHQFQTALTLNKKYLPEGTVINEIDIMNNIVSDTTGTETNIHFPGRKLLITSGGSGRHIIDFKGSHPNLQGREKLDLTYKNVTIWSSDFYGVARTNDYRYTTYPDNTDNTAVITLDDVDFHGSQVLYVGDHNEIHIKDTVTVDQVRNAYTSLVDGSQAKGGGDNQQIFEFTSAYNSLYFDEGSKFVGNTLDGTAIEMNGNNDNVYIAKGADVTLNPLKNNDGKFNANSGEHGTIYAIWINGKGSVNVKGHLTINLGQSDYAGKLDKKQAQAINLNNGNTEFVIDSNGDGTGGTVDITTNGDISGNNSGYLIKDKGNFTVKPNGALNITGQDMGDYKGTLVNIGNKADIENGAFNIRLNGDKSIGAGTGAGTNDIILVNVEGNGKLIVNNPTSLVLNCSANHSSGTSIIGDNAITITNVRQKLNFLGDEGLTLPPFHTLQVHKNKSIVVDKLVLLNGKGGENGKYMFTPEVWSNIQKLPYFNNPKLTNIKDYLNQMAQLNTPISFDKIFSDIITAAFSDPTNIGYNDIAFGPANSSGFLDIKPESVTAKANVDASGKKDGSWTISGIVDGYKNEKDGPDSDPKNPFKLILPLGTKAYIMAEIDSGKGTISLNNKIDDPPYQYTNNDAKDLPTKFAGEVTQSGKNYIFNVKVPADIVSQINSNTKIKLTPTANFIEYNPLDVESKERPVIVSILKIAQDTAAKNINSKVDAANKLDGQFPMSNPKSKEQVDLENAINSAKKVAQTASDPGYDSGKSVYGAGNVDEVSKREEAALKALKDAMDPAQKAVEQIQAAKQAKDEAQKAITTAANNAISRVKQQSALTDAEKAQYIDAINSAEKVALENPSTNKNSIYNPANKPSDITNIQNAFENKVNKEAAKAEVAGYTENGKKTLGVSSDEIDEALSEQLKAIDDATDVVKAENDAKSTILGKLKASAKAKVQKDARDAKEGLGVKSDTNIDQAFSDAAKAIDDHTDFTDIKNDMTKGQTNVLNNYKTAAKNQLTDMANTDKGALGVKSDDNIDQAVNNASSLIGQSSSIAMVTGNLKDGKTNVGNSFKDSAKKQVQDYADEAKSNLGVDTDAGIDAAAKTAEDAIDGHTAASVIGSDITKGKEAILAAYKESAKKQLDQAEKDVESKLEKVKGLTANDIEKAKQAAKDLLANSNKTGYEDQIDDPKTNTLDDVNTATKDGIDALNNLLISNSSLGNKNDAINAINQARDNAIKEINDKAKYPNLSDGDRNSLINTIKADATEGVDNVNKDTDPAKITADKQAAIDKINSVKATAASKDLAGLNKEKSSQLKALQDAATNAKDTIDKIPDKYLSPSNKQYYKDLIDKHAASATNAINSASNKDAMDTAEKDGESNINGDLVLGQVTAAKAQAIAELNAEKDTDKGIVNDAHKNGTLSDDDWVKDLDDIDNAYTTAITAVSNDHTPADVVTDKNTGINAMKAVADSVSQDQDKVDLAKAKNNAIADLEDQAQALHDHIQADPNLSNTEKNNYFDQISSTLNNAKQAVSAADKNTVNSAHNAGIEDLNDIRNNADLQSARDKALTDLQHEFNTDNAAVDGLTNISTAGKAGIKTDLQNAYNDAVKKVKDPTSNTVAKINSQSDAGITNMENILGKAKGLDKTISDDKQKLNDYAQQAINRINSSTMSDADKGAATTNIQKARDDAEALVGKQLTVEDANKAEKDGETGILQAEAKANKADMDKAKNEAKSKIDGAQKTALQNLKDAYDALTDDEKKQAQAAYDKAVKDIPALAEQAEAAIDKAFDKDTISGLTNDAINSINSAGDTANVAMTKVVAVQAVKDAAQAAKDKLTNKRDKDGVDDVAKLGIADINAATTSSTVLQIKDNALNSIKNIKDSGTGDASADDALWAKKNKANAELAQELADTDSAIDKLTDLTADQKKQFKDQAQAAHDRAHIRIEGAAETDIETEKGLGKDKIDKALSDAKFQAAKNVAKADVDKTADDAIDKVNKDNTISKDDKDKIIININNDRDKAKDKIDHAETPDDINNAQQNGKDDINKEINHQGDNGNGTDTAQIAKDKQTAKDNIQTAADKINDRIDKDEKDGKLSHDQAKALKDKVTEAVDKAKGAISQAGDPTTINKAQNDGNNALSQITSDVDKTEAVNNALGKISDAVNVANGKADELGKNDKDLAKQMKDAIEKERAKAAKNIQNAQNDAKDPIKAIDNAAQDGVNAITGLTDNYGNKVDHIKTLKDAANKAKDDLNKLKTDEKGNNVLDGNELAQGEADIDNAVQNGISNIYQASADDDLDKIEKDAEHAVELAKLPTKLLAEKNKQIAAINQYAADAEKTIDGFAQTDKNKAGLPADTIAELKAQVEAAKNKAISKINDIALAEGASQDDFDKAKDKVDKAEKGVAEGDETVDFGEAGIDKVKTLAQQKADIIKAKNDANARLEQEHEKEVNAIENSGMSDADQKPLKDQVQQLVDKAKDQIINISDTDDKGKVKTPEQVTSEANTIIQNTVDGFDENGNKVTGIKDIVDQAKLDGAKTTAEKTLNDKRAQAHDIIKGSQLTADQKQKANEAIDKAFTDEKSAIDGKTNIKDVPTNKDEIGKAIEAICTKPSEWFDDEQKNALSGKDDVAGLQAGLDKLTAGQKADPDYKDYLDDINNAIAAINKAENIKDASSAYDKGMTSLNKLNALQKVKNEANEAKTDIDNNDKLDDNTKDRLKGDVDKVVEDTKDKLNQIDSSNGTAASNKDKIDQINKDAQNDINVVINDADAEGDPNISHANSEISKNHSDAIDTIHNEFGDDSKTPKTDDAYEKNKHVHSSTQDGINSDKTNADKEISKGAIDDAVDIAKDKVNHLKHEDGTDYTDADKNKINEQIDKDAKDAKDKIDKSDNVTDIDNIRDNGIHQIHQDCSDTSTIDKILHGDNNNNNNNNGNNGGGGIATPIQPATPAKNPTADNTSNTNKDDGTKVDMSNSSDVTLMHNAYLYDETGKRANKITLGAGSVLTTYGTKTINGKDYYVLVDKGAKNKVYYVAAGNIDHSTRKLKHNAYIYNQFGKRVKKTGVYKKGKLIKTFGAAVKIRGKKYFIIGKNRFVKAANFAKGVVAAGTAKAEVVPTSAVTEKPQVTVEKTLMHNAYLYDKNGTRANKLIFQAGSQVETVGKKTVNGKACYELPDGMFIAAGNIDAKKLKLKHNAYVYNQYGHRANKKVLKKRKSVKTYGNSVKINGKRYFIISKGRFVKKANF